MSEQPKLTPTQAKVVKAKVEAELADIPQAVVAQQVFPHATPASAGVMMSRELKKVNVQEALQEALAKHNLTPDRIMGIVDDAMGAQKTVAIGSGEDAVVEHTPDHSIRLKAAGMAAQFMGIGKNQSETTNFNFINVQKQDKEAFDL